MEYLVLLIVCLRATSSAENSTHFIYPPDSSNLTFHCGDTVNVEWTSTYLPWPGSGPYLNLWCGPDKDLLPLHFDATTNGTKAMSFTNIGFSGWPLPIGCYFGLDYNSTGNSSAAFTLDEQDPYLLPYTWAAATKVTTTSAPSSSATTAPSPTSSQVTQVATRIVTTVQTNAATATNPPRSSRLSPGAKVGVGVSCTAVGLAMIAALAYLLLRSKSGEQKTNPEPHCREERRSDMVYQKAELSNEHTRHELPEALLQELPGESQLHELPGEQNGCELEGDKRA